MAGTTYRHWIKADNLANSIFMQEYTGNSYFEFIFDSWSFTNCSGNADQTNIDLVGIGIGFYNNIVTNNQGSIIRFRFYDDGTPKIVTPIFDLQGNLFANNYDVSYILEYVPSVITPGATIYRLILWYGNTFDGNDGGILNIPFDHYDFYLSRLVIGGNVIRHYNNPGYALFTLSTTEGPLCTSGAYIRCDMKYNIFELNIDTQLLDSTCFSMSVYQMNLYNNTMPTLSIQNAPISSTPIINFGRFSNPSYTDYWVSNNNQGILLRIVGSTYLSTHSVTNHKRNLFFL